MSLPVGIHSAGDGGWPCLDTPVGPVTVSLSVRFSSLCRAAAAQGAM